MSRSTQDFRRTTQHLAPATRQPPPPGAYDIYPAFPLGSGRIQGGFDARARAIADSGDRTVMCDGFAGVLWDPFIRGLSTSLATLGLETTAIDVRGALLQPEAVDRLIAPYLGGDDPLYGTRAPLRLDQFFDTRRLRALPEATPGELLILYGSGAALSRRDGLLIYVDVPKNEVQFRSRAGVRVLTLGTGANLVYPLIGHAEY